MNQKEYNKLSEKTLSYNFYVIEQRDKNLLHASMGLMTEVVELIENYDLSKKYDKTNIEEEIGDCCWYFSIILRELNLDYDFIKSKTLEPVHEKDRLVYNIRLIKRTAQLLDYHKKMMFYGKPLDEQVYTELFSKIAGVFLMIVLVEDLKVDKIFDKNIAKLKARYGEKFNEEKALNRNIDKERNILEKK